MVDETRLLALLDRIGAELVHLRRLAALEPGVLAADVDKLAAVKYRFIVAIEAAIDACRHVVASEGLRTPVDFADAFTVVGETGFLPAELTPSMGDMARFRNLLVHGYAQIDDERVVALLQTRLGDLDRFRAALASSVLEPSDEA